ncbi:F-box domain protein [Geosmithia morbida]|uniref:F-box domain protein n=1 Tax=Geosmithia morbida TaxID=1094350 RepID=A0A9P4YWT4_9HYPO|nr:F-box domain protein [Geosmithia morbida]KAF4124305.1 F-box domain protein [Geosmithia morbida]
MDSLPPEILDHIISCLDDTDTATDKLYGEPADLLDASLATVDIKNASLVNSTWRNACRRRLFQHIRWTIRPEEYEYQPAEGSYPPPLGHDLHRFLDSIATTWPGGESVVANVRSLRLVSGEAKGTFCMRRDATANLWPSIFSRINPRRVTAIGDPAALSIILGLGYLEGSSAWMFDLPIQLVQVTRRNAASTDPSTSYSCRGMPTLFSVRQWDSLLLNEGSFIPTYATYDYHHHVQPSLLHMLPASDGIAFDDFAYVSAFPTSPYFTVVFLLHMPTAKNIYIQIVPRELDFTRRLPPSTLGHLDIRDPWMECISVWSSVGDIIFRGADLRPRWKHVDTFEMGATDHIENIWNDVEHRAVAQKPGELRWGIARQGLLVRR